MLIIFSITGICIGILLVFNPNFKQSQYKINLNWNYQIAVLIPFRKYRDFFLMWDELYTYVYIYVRAIEWIMKKELDLLLNLRKRYIIFKINGKEKNCL